MSSLNELDFGRYDADTDPNLLDYFITTGTTQKIERRKYLVTGRKGAGKTALFRHIASEWPNRAIQMDLEGYSFSAHKNLIEAGLPRAIAYAASWRLSISIATYLRARGLLNKAEQKQGDQAIAALSRGKSAAPIKQIIGWLKRVRKFQLPAIEGLADLGGLELTEESKQLDESTLTELQSLEELLFETWGKHESIVTIDRLDEATNGTDEPIHLITGAVIAARHFFNHVNPKDVAPVVVFLRTDIWDAISYNDKNKTKQDTLALDWTHNELAKVVAERGHTTTNVPRDLVWSTFFPTDEMRNRQSAQNYIIKRTMRRPRDIVAFCDYSLEAARDNEHTSIFPEDIYTAEAKYSQHLLAELNDEIVASYPNWTAVVNCLKGLPGRTFTLPDWESSARRMGLSEGECKRVFDLLFEASAIGIYSAGGRQGGSGTQFRYEDKYLLPGNDSTLQVHQGLITALGLKDR